MIRAMWIVWLCTRFLALLPKGEPTRRALALAISDFLAVYLDQLEQTSSWPRTRTTSRDFAAMSAEIRRRG